MLLNLVRAFLWHCVENWICHVLYICLQLIKSYSSFSRRRHNPRSRTSPGNLPGIGACAVGGGKMEHHFPLKWCKLLSSTNCACADSTKIARWCEWAHAQLTSRKRSIVWVITDWKHNRFSVTSCRCRISLVQILFQAILILSPVFRSLLKYSGSNKTQHKRRFQNYS